MYGVDTLLDILELIFQGKQGGARGKRARSSEAPRGGAGWLLKQSVEHNGVLRV